MITTFFFVRHATPNFSNHDDMTRELTPQGKIDCARVTRFLTENGADVVLSSPYHRAIDTVKGFADSRHLPVIPIADFRERAVGETWIDDFDAFARRQWADFLHKLPGGESLSELESRNVAALRDALFAYPGRRIAVGGHGTAISVLIHHFMPEFGYDGFASIQRKMPWIAEFVFDGDILTELRQHDIMADP